MEKFIRINVDLAGYTAGQKWPYDKAPDVVKMWLENEDISVGTRICSLVTEDGKQIDHKDISVSQEKDILLRKFSLDKPDSLENLNDATKKLYKTCKGVKTDKTPCSSRMLVGDTGYCKWHQDQA